MADPRVVTLVHSLRERLDATLADHPNDMLLILSRIEEHGKGILKTHQLLAEFEAICESDKEKLQDHAFQEVLKFTQEGIVLPSTTARGLGICACQCPELFLCESLVNLAEQYSSIGNGVEFLNRHLSAKMFHDRDSLTPLLDFLGMHHYKGKTMMLNDRIRNLNSLQAVLRQRNTCQHFLQKHHTRNLNISSKRSDWREDGVIMLNECMR
ncbi:unnamed protein product [Fraxinus pennsylvanica]|uniref:sucrose synthase n=1 Tax=Fraxinus pennsylvanica TaxID=56036 RepID=A0AAD2DVZ1_9LAMI|nr:unnamed protein product [Fraxinus pennsylvanica]